MSENGNEIEIENGIPIPRPQDGHGRRAKYPWAKLEVGQSFLVQPNECESRIHLWNRIGSINTHARKKFPEKRFTTRTVEGGVRVWRVE